MAREVSTWSADPSTKVGAVIVNERRVILSTGWNGLPRGMADTPARLNDRDFKYRYTVHAESNAIANAARIGASLEGSDLYVYGLPVCSDCAKLVAQAGIRTVYMCVPCIRDKWEESHAHSLALFNEVGVRVRRWDSGHLGGTNAFEEE